MNKASKGYFRKEKYSASLIPMHEEDSHPVYHSHCNILPWKALHVVNRMSKQLSFFNKSYIVELRGTIGIASASITKYDFDLKKRQDSPRFASTLCSNFYIILALIKAIRSLEFV